MNLFSGGGLLLGFTSLVLTFIIVKYGKTKLHLVWALFNISVAIWGIGAFFVGRSSTVAASWLSWRFAHLGIIFIPILIFHVSYLLCELNRKMILIAIYLQGVFFLALVPTRLFITDMRIVFDSFYYLAPGPLYLPFFIIWTGLVLYAHYELFLKYRKSQGIKRNQILYFFLGAAVGFAGGITNFMPAFGINLYPYGNLAIPLYCIIVTYAILKYQLMDIEVIIRRAVVFAGLFAAVYGVFAFFTFLTQDVFQYITGGNRWATLIPAILIMILVLKPLENFLVKITDRFLFQKKYDYKELLRTLSREVMTIMDLDKLARRTVEDLVNIMRLESCAIMVYEKNENRYRLIASKGIKSPNIILSKEDPLISVLKTTHMPIQKDEYIEKMGDKNTIKEDMKKVGAEFILPLMLHDELIGLISLGMKKSGEEYNQDDMATLEALAGTAAVAISNAQYVVNTMQLEAEAAQREKMAVIGTLAAGINHEICNPLGIARGQCEVFLLNKKEGLYDNKPKDEQIAEALRIMEKVVYEADRATAITRKLSSFAKPSRGEISDDVKIGDEIDEVIALVDHELKLEKIDTVMDIPGDIPFMRCDRKQLQQVLFNIIRNAGQAIGEKGVITISAAFHNGRIRIEIKDTGPGIPENKLSEIFNPFYTTKDPGKGTGLGLFIVRQLVERNKGKISVESELGKGTTFTLEFPAMKGVKV